MVFIPGEATSGTYAASKGFDNLTDITSGQGFWVDSKADQQVTISGTPDYSPLTFTTGWNLAGLKSDQAISVTAMTSLNSDIVLMWVWENGNWLVAMPEEKSMGAYAASKKFGDLTTIYPLEGFWVNVKSSQAGTTTTTMVTTGDAVTALTTTCLSCHGNNQSEVNCSNSAWTSHSGSKVDAATFDAVSNYLTGVTCSVTTGQNGSSDLDDDEGDDDDSDND